MTESIFGNLDVESVGSPWDIAPNTYRCVCTKSFKIEENGQWVWKITYQIDEPDSEFDKNTIRDRFGLWPDKSWNDYTADEKKATKYLMARLREGFDLTDEEIKVVTPDQLIGKVLYITTVNNPGKDGDRVFVNVNRAISERLYAEQRAEQGDAAAASMGL